MPSSHYSCRTLSNIWTSPTAYGPQAAHLVKSTGLPEGEHRRAVADAVPRYVFLLHLRQQSHDVVRLARPPARRDRVIVADRLSTSGARKRRRRSQNRTRTRKHDSTRPGDNLTNAVCLETTSASWKHFHLWRAGDESRQPHRVFIYFFDLSCYPHLLEKNCHFQGTAHGKQSQVVSNRVANTDRSLGRSRCCCCCFFWGGASDGKPRIQKPFHPSRHVDGQAKMLLVTPTTKP